MSERLTWNQMIEKYPDKWLALSDCKLDEENDATIIEANIIKVFETWDDYYTFRDNNIGKGYRYEYTAEPIMSGVQFNTNNTPERLTWKQMVEKYPDKWLALSDCKYYDNKSEATIIEATVYKVFNTDEEYENFRIKNIGKGYRYRYTTELVISGVTYGENFTVGIR